MGGCGAASATVAAVGAVVGAEAAGASVMIESVLSDEVTNNS